jgi:hypothetical protein
MRQPWGLVSAYRLDVTSLQTRLQDPDAEEFVTHTAPLRCKIRNVSTVIELCS